MLIRSPAMGRHIFNIATVCSLIATVAFVSAWPLARHTDPRTQRIALPGGWYASLDAYGADGQDARVVVFNDSFGPYCGGILWNAGPKGLTPNTPQPVNFGDTFGVYYRSIPPDPSSGSTRWWKTLRISLAYPLVLATLVPLLWLYRLRVSKRQARGFSVEGRSAAG